jgi:hypothetical protein
MHSLTINNAKAGDQKVRKLAEEGRAILLEPDSEDSC